MAHFIKKSFETIKHLTTTAYYSWLYHSPFTNDSNTNSKLLIHFALIAHNKKIESRSFLLLVPPYISGFVCPFHLAAPGSSPKHTIYAFINLYLNCSLWNRRKRTEKRPTLAHFKNIILLIALDKGDNNQSDQIWK